MTALRKLRFWSNDDARHRAEGDARTAAYPPSFRPRHCGGQTCFHDHAGDRVLWTNHQPVVARSS